MARVFVSFGQGSIWLAQPSLWACGLVPPKLDILWLAHLGLVVVYVCVSLLGHLGYGQGGNSWSRDWIWKCFFLFKYLGWLDVVLCYLMTCIWFALKFILSNWGWTSSTVTNNHICLNNMRDINSYFSEMFGNIALIVCKLQILGFV